MMKPEIIADYKCETGEGPLWHPEEKRVYWVDIPQGGMFRYDPMDGSHEKVYEGRPVGGFTIQVDGSLLLFMDKGSVKIWREGALETVIEEIPGENDSRFNDVIADPEGRVFCGTMPTEDHPGRLYRLNRDGSLQRILEGIKVPNGLGFTPDIEKMYFTESRARKIYLFDYDRDTGKISNQRTFVQTEKGEGIPDGMTVDQDGNAWSARWNGGCLVKYTANGKEVLRIDFPTKKVSSLTFGGEDYNDLYVTTAGGGNKEEEGEGAGALFRLSPESAKGKREFLSKIQIH